MCYRCGTWPAHTTILLSLDTNDNTSRNTYSQHNHVRTLAFALQMRHQIDQLLEELWRDERCRASMRTIAAAAAADGGASAAAAPGASSGVNDTTLFPAFISAVLNDLIYLFKDSLERLADIKTIEDSRADAEVRYSSREDHQSVYGCVCAQRCCCCTSAMLCSNMF